MTAPKRRVWAVVPAAGRGSRFDPANAKGPKQYEQLLGRTVIEWSLSALLAEPRIAGIVVALAADDRRFSEIASSLVTSKILIATGGATRQESVMNGLEALNLRADGADWVLVHDAARPCLRAADLSALLDAVEQSGVGALLAAPIVDTVKRERANLATETVERSGLWRALTPQVFGIDALKRALKDAVLSGVAVTDEAQAMERMGHAALLVQGSPFNLKITTPADLSMAEAILNGTERSGMRIGQGFDVHAFGAGDHVVLGGVRIAYPRGVVAHSDGDVVIHALCDALLGALGKGDIGQHFPDTDAKFKGADSRAFLRDVAHQMHMAGFALANADVTVLAEAPRISKHRDAMRDNLASDLGVPAETINIKATTTEKLGFIGRGEGLAASAAVLLTGRSPR